MGGLYHRLKIMDFTMKLKAYYMTFFVVLFTSSCRPNLTIDDVPITYSEIDQKRIDSLSLFPLLSGSSLNNKIEISFDFAQDRVAAK